MFVNTLGLVFLRLGFVRFLTINLRLLYLKLIVSAKYSLSRLKNEGTLESVDAYIFFKLLVLERQTILY